MERVAEEIRLNLSDEFHDGAGDGGLDEPAQRAQREHHDREGRNGDPRFDGLAVVLVMIKKCPGSRLVAATIPIRRTVVMNSVSTVAMAARQKRGRIFKEEKQRVTQDRLRSEEDGVKTDHGDAAVPHQGEHNVRDKRRRKSERGTQENARGDGEVYVVSRRENGYAHGHEHDGGQGAEQRIFFFCPWP